MSPIQDGLLALISGGSWTAASLLTASVMYGHILSAADNVGCIVKLKTDRGCLRMMLFASGFAATAG